ncbi:hypothetical protein RD792_006103 [Penstemon davidsonii]|uniref:C3H1-type domain-containing protein n=1 Tax=Penstemon davidsonii TaxID=160366 RepID=A0ABR0DDG3_9LAMI|nr:hypothetical protein RD792_006103 [Penstemon davidsonii]
MDLPPPQPPLFRHQNRLHFRYDNPTHLPGFSPPPFPRHPPPPPPPQPAYPSLLPFSPPRFSVMERSRFYEFNPPPKPNFDSNTLPPPPPPRVNLPLRFSHDYSDRNENFGRRCSDNLIDRLPPENLHWGAAQLNNKVSDSGVYQRYSNLLSSGHRLYYERHGTDERRWDIGINGRSHELYNERDGDQRRIGYDVNDQAHELYNGRYDNPRRWGYGTTDLVYELHKNEGNDDQRRWGYGTYNRASELHNERDDDRTRRGYGINGWGCELYNDRDHDRRRRGYGIHDGFMQQPDNRQHEIFDSDLGAGRFSGMLGNGASEKDFIRYSKKRRVQRISSSCRNELGKVCRRRTEDYHSQHISEESRSYSFGGKGKEDLEGLVSRTEDKKEHEQYRLELAISFKSNALVAEAILTPASPAVNIGMDITPSNSNIREENSIPSSQLAKYSKDMVKSDVLACGLDSQSDAHEIPEELLEKSTVSGSGSGITSDSKLSGYNVENEPQEDSISLQMTSDRGEITSDKIDAPSAVLHLDVYTTLREIQKVPDTDLVSKKVDVEGYRNEPSGPNSKRKRSCLTTLPASLHVADNMVTQCPGHTERLLTSTENTYHGCQFRIDEAEGRVDETVLANEDIGHGDSLGFSQHTDYVDISDREAGQREDTQLPAFTTADKCGGTTSGEVKVDKENFSSSDMGKTLEDVDKLLVKDNLAKDVQMGLSGPKNNEHHETASSSNGEVAQVWANDFISAAEVKIPHERESCEEDGSSSEGTFGVEDSSLGFDFGAEGSFPVFRKKRKVANPILTPSPLLEDDLIADGLTSNRSKLDQASSPLPDKDAGQREDTHSPAVRAADKCGSIVVEVKDCKGNFSCSDMGKTLDDGDNILMKDNLALKEDLSSCSNNNACFPNSSDELTDSDSDPEDLLSFSDFSLPSNPKASPSQPRNRIVYGAEERFNRKPVSAYPNNTFSLGKFVQKATSGNAQTVAKIPPPVPQGTSKLVQNLNLVHGKPILKKSQQKSAVPNVFPRPINSNRSSDFPSTHATKSRTWHRTGSSSVAVAGTKLRPWPLPQSRETNMPRTAQSSYMRKGNSLVRKPSPSTATPPGLSSSIYKRSPCIDNLKKKQPSNGKIDGVDAPTVHRIEPVNICESPEAPPIDRSVKSSNSTTCNLRESSSGNGCSSKILGALDVIKKSSAIPENCQNGSCNNSDSQSTLDQRNSRKKIKYVKRRSNQLVAASDFEEESISGVDKIQSSFSDGYYKSRKNQLVRASVAENHATNGDAVAEVNSSKLVLQELPLRSSGKRQSSKGFAKTYRSTKFSFVWKLHDVLSSQKHNHPERSQKVLSHLFPWKRATYRRSVMLALGSKPNNYSAFSQKMLLSRKRGAVYTKSTHGYSLRMSKVLSVGGSSLKWSKSIERISKKTNEEATRAVAAAEKRKKEEKIAVPIVSKSRNHVSRKLVLSVKPRAGERIFRIGSERYKMDPTRRTLCRITEEKPSSSIVIQPEKIVKRSYVPKRLFIGNDEYVRIGTGNQLIRDPKKRTRVLASEKVRWSLRTARMRLARKRKYCQFFTRFGKCNKEDGKCPYIHDPSKIAVCTKFLNGSCSNPDCKLTHKVIPERMQDCSYFVKGSCSNENCPYRHVNVDPDSSVCESFLRGYCIDGNEERGYSPSPVKYISNFCCLVYCRKKHTYVCPAFEETGICPQASMCKLHHPKKKTENKPKSEQKSVLGRYFDGGLIGVADCSSMDTSEKLSAKDAQIADPVELMDPSSIMIRDSLSPAIEGLLNKSMLIAVL